MPQSATLVLIPFLGSILVYLGIFYAREKAIDKTSRNFILACVSILGLASYLFLRVLEAVGGIGTIVYAVIGTLLLIWALISTRI